MAPCGTPETCIVTTPTIQSSLIPRELKERKHWVNWQIEVRDGKPTKIPKNPQTGQNASVTDASTWASFGEAFAKLSKQPKLNGIGFVFTADDPYCGIDC